MQAVHHLGMSTRAWSACSKPSAKLHVRWSMQAEPLSVRHSVGCAVSKRCSTAASITSHTTSPLCPPAVAARCWCGVGRRRNARWARASSVASDDSALPRSTTAHERRRSASRRYARAVSVDSCKVSRAQGG